MNFKHGQKYPRPDLSEMNKLQRDWKFKISTARTLNGFFRQYGWTKDSFFATMISVAPLEYSMQVDVPHSEYGPVSYFMPLAMREWLKEKGLRYIYCGGGSWGDGYTNGITNATSSYVISNIEKEDSTAFQIIFPKCVVHLNESHDFSMI